MNSVNLITTAYVFGTSAIIFAVLPFAFVMFRGIMKSKQSHHQSSLIGIIGISYLVHFISCVGFIMLIKSLDLLNKMYMKDYFETKIFPIFWARTKSEVFALSGSTGTTEEEGAYAILHIIQVGFDFFILFMPFITIFVAISYSYMKMRKDSYQANALSFVTWLIVSSFFMVAMFVFWAKVASIALFMPNAQDILTYMQDQFKNLLR